MKKMYLTPLAEVVKTETEVMICVSGFIEPEQPGWGGGGAPD